MPVILGYPFINWYIGFVIFCLFCLFVKIHIITPKIMQQKMELNKNLSINNESNEIPWDEIFNMEKSDELLTILGYLRNIAGDIFLCITPLILIYWIVKKFIKKDEISVTDKNFFAAHTLVNISIFFLTFAIIAYICVAYRYDMVNTFLKIELYYDLYTLDLYSITIKVMILLTSIFILHNSRTYILLHTNQMLEFTVLLTLAVFFLSILVSSNDLIVLFISIIGFSLNMYVLLMSDFDRRASLEAGIKYFYLSAFSSGLLISGIWLAFIIFFSTQFTDIKLILDHWWHLSSNPILENQGILQIMIYSIVYGFLFKLAAFPCHLWAPEVYEGSPNPIMAFFILPVKIATFALFIRLLTNVFKDIYSMASYIIWFSAWSSMLWGCYGAFTELKLRKFIAFSSINQMGFLLIGVACGTFIGIRATLIYLFIYIIMNCGLLQIFLTTYANKDNLTLDFITDFKYFARDNKVYAVLLIIIMFSMAGIPPLAGFFGKYFLFVASIKSGYYFLVIIGMLTSLISTFYYIRIIKIMWFDEHYTILPTIQFINTMDRVGRLTYFSLIIFIILFILFINSIFSFTNLITISCILWLKRIMKIYKKMTKFILENFTYFYKIDHKNKASSLSRRDKIFFFKDGFRGARLKVKIFALKMFQKNKINWKRMKKLYFVFLLYLAPHTPEYYKYKIWVNEFYDPDIEKRIFLKRLASEFFNNPDDFSKYWNTLNKPIWEKYPKEYCFNYLKSLIDPVYSDYKASKVAEGKNWKVLYEDHRNFDDFIAYLCKKFEVQLAPNHWIDECYKVINQYHYFTHHPLNPKDDIVGLKDYYDIFLLLVKTYKENPRELKLLFEQWDFIGKEQNLSLFFEFLNNYYWLLVYSSIFLTLLLWCLFIRKIIKIDKFNFICEIMALSGLILGFIEYVIPIYPQYYFPIFIYIPFVWLAISLLLFILEGVKIIQLVPIIIKLEHFTHKSIMYICSWISFTIGYVFKFLWKVIKKFLSYFDFD